MSPVLMGNPSIPVETYATEAAIQLDCRLRFDPSPGGGENFFAQGMAFVSRGIIIEKHETRLCNDKFNVIPLQGFFYSGILKRFLNNHLVDLINVAKRRTESMENFLISVSSTTSSDDSINARFRFACSAVMQASP
jgi:hypothetical protein